MARTSLVLMVAMCALVTASQREEQDHIQVYKNLLKYDFRAFPNIDGNVVEATAAPELDLEDIVILENISEDLEHMKTPNAVEEETYPSEILKLESVKTDMQIMRTHIGEEIINLQFAIIQIVKKMEVIAKSLDTALNKRIDDITAQINTDILKRLNELEIKYKDKLNAPKDTITDEKAQEAATDGTLYATYGTNLIETNTVDSRGAETVSSTSEQPAGDYDEEASTYKIIIPTVTADNAETTTKESNQAESTSNEQEVGGDDEWDAVRVLSVNGERGVSWRTAFCQDLAEDATSPARAWGPGDVPDADMYDVRLHTSTGCRRRLVPPYDRQSFHWYSPRHELSGEQSTDWSPYWSRQVPEQRLALRTVGEGRADINIYWNGEKKYYFAFSNSSSTLEFIRITPWKRLWMVQLPEPVEGREHYLPLHFTLTEEELRWEAGCMAEVVLTSSVRTAPTDCVTLEIETSAFPAKLLYDCPRDKI